MPIHRQTRLPFEPVARLVPTSADEHRRGAPVRSARQIADYLGVSTRRVYRWRREGIRYYDADRVALALGLHPLLVWPDYYDTDDYADGWEHPSLADQGA